jgi:hypothetical protein
MRSHGFVLFLPSRQLDRTWNQKMALPSIGQRVLERSILQNKQRQIQIEGLTGGQVFEQPIFIVLLDCFRHADSMGP